MRSIKTSELNTGLLKKDTYMSYPAWAVAAAIMGIEGGEWHYEILTHRIMESKLSGLGSRGGKTPWKTLRVDIADKHSDAFELRGYGYYKLHKENEIIRNHEVRTVIGLLFPAYLNEYNTLIKKTIKDNLIGNKVLEMDCNRISELEIIFHRLSGVTITL